MESIPQLTLFSAVLLIHAFASVFMCGLIWFVQIVHYPLMVQLDPGLLRSYAPRHQRKTGFVVGPIMIIELAGAVAITWMVPADSDQNWLAAVGLALLGVIWFSTAFVQVPLHRSLAAEPNPRDAARLVQTNWIRTIAWTVRAIIALMLLVH